ncbi:MAG: radical SAM protein [Acidobacteriota bacterium]|jgi:hypothetical protein|nr:radical SAM protein [Acidobacteriota bacterium]NLT34096.1 radical SAM protein [Acidobacteriota bacterium]
MTRLLLCGVYKPYGVQDDTGEALCTMELLNNQVTREQGIHSPRSSNPSFGLYLLAENLNVPVTVLDFPTWEEFTREIDTGGYSHVGISFIVPNVLKARRMAEYIRKAAPRAKIILGGHGTAIPGIRELVDCDEVCHGEGVAWLRHYFGEETDRPIVHPVVESAVNGYVYGAPLLGKAGILIPGVGCQNSCRFCSTSHKFDRKYTPFLATGEEMFEACRKAEQVLGVDDFGVIDENFCKEPARARELLAEMERNGKAYSFSIFSSAETLAVLGIDFLLRLGVNFIWIGVESKANLFEKTRGVDLHRLVAELQDHGISVLASSILFLEHHDKKTIHEDIEWALSLESDFSQFMGLGPTPGTQLYRDYEAAGKLLAGIPWPKKHGQDEIWFHHPEFTLPESARYLKDAFVRKYEEQGPGVLAMAHTAVKGYLALRAEIEDREKKGLAWDPETMRYVQGQAPAPDPFMRLRLERVKKTALMFRPALGAMMRYAPNARAEAKCRKVMAMYREAFGPMSLTDRLKAMAVRVFALRESRRIRKEGVVMRQPPTRRVTYPERKAVARCPVQREAMIA